MVCDLARLDSEKLDAITSYEKTTGHAVLAFSCKDISPASLKETELKALKDLERRLGLVLLAYK